MGAFWLVRNYSDEIKTPYVHTQLCNEALLRSRVY